MITEKTTTMQYTVTSYKKNGPFQNESEIGLNRGYY